METSKILEILFRIYPQSSVKYIFLYGSDGELSGDKNDIDVMAIVASPEGIFTSIQLNNLDIAFVDENTMIKMASMLDPIIIEPMIAGRQVYGESLTPSINALKSSKPGDSSIIYLRDVARQFIRWADYYILDGNRREALMCLSYAISYHFFAEYYRTNKDLILFSNLERLHPDSLLTKIRTVEKTPTSVTWPQIENLFKEAKSLLS